MTKFLIVELEGVTSSVPRSNFQETDLDILADSILECGGILKPLGLKKIGFEKYEVIDGHFEYYAAVRAREKNPNRGEIVNAFIIPDEKEDAVLNQVAFLQSSNTAEKIVNPPDEKSELGKLLDQNKQIYAKMNHLISNPPVNTDNSSFDEKLKAIENRIDNLYSVVEKLATLVEKLIPQPKLKLNLLTAKDEEIMIALSEVGVKPNYIKAALQAIKYWKETDKTLTWQNLLISTKTGKHKITGFADATYQKLKQIAEIRTE
jgi:hypothetical protein